MAVIMGMSTRYKSRRNLHLLGIKPIRKMVDCAQIGIKLTLMGGKYFCVIQNVPPLTPFKAVKSVNLPAAGIVMPMGELFIEQLLITPLLITIVFTVWVITFGFINHNNHGCVGLPVVGSRKAEYGILMFVLGTVVAISFPLRLLSTQQKLWPPLRGRWQPLQKSYPVTNPNGAKAHG